MTPTIKDAAAAVANGDMTSEALVRKVFEMSHEKENTVHAFLELYESSALKEACMVDEVVRTGGGAKPLLGIPIAIKDNIVVSGHLASAASRMLETYHASYDATVIKRLRDAGAIIVGRTNMDEFAMGSSTENSAYGTTKNPHDLSRIPGGSSGGSAAAVAAGECAAALGSDTGGSIRQPAALCGVVGLKPTYGAVSRHGLIAMASSLDVIGPITKTVEDAEVIFNVIKGKDPLDSTTVERAVIPEQSAKEIRIGIPKEYFGAGLHPEVKQAVENTLQKLQASSAGWRIKLKEISLPYADYALPCYYIIMPAEVSTNLARFDGIRYGLSEKSDDLLEVYTKSRRSGFGEEVRRRVLLGTYILSAGYYDAYYIKAQQVRSLIKRDFEKAFEEVDVIASPTTPTPAFKFGEKSNDPVEMYLSDIYTVSANLAGIPALSVPCGMSSEGLPIGIQFMGRWLEEDTLFRVGKKVEEFQ
ncbi:MAG: glutaminyl-tRNA synthase (glutamine-hydrolyzing) subunit A [Candidatus Ryanbacteria bacterium RIFCSPHIGHO2_01_FULL_45_22]|uniref:Glutamyl-tRNA(Gln) amidotransferase subunit A n=2 Tax=Candidatus Ryaniibacteriota TaxID=1817914 RepID=A0A1G2FZA7_9BACT|nr:MAG: glutaminyl-tRNA synthase (glutamine-hydrolyzing) subunit A [Candidatus Ryanbacteria bacterium RIFCSPHIGHO2_01_FULL_45_22]OGZ45377.1 MAG: glutaminyl-tRNA synthase (glutamine-hydrolyzing) subunit A [Candidatus Ryanbacteria bacterium RIFCSPHIGHO2_02_FULL_45_13b]